jgi:peroxiredoxin Q/BCP
MRMMIATMVVGGLSMAAVAMAQAPPAGPQVGDPAPAFSLQGSDGAMHSLAEFKGKKAVVVAWFPKAFTGG